MSGESGIAIRMTAPGLGALGTIRLRGPGVQGFLARHLSCAVQDGQAVHGTFSSSGRIIDDPVVAWDAAAQQAELHVHGGHWVIHEILQAASAADFMVVDQPGLPLPPEAVDAATPLEAEILQWLPLATTREAAASLLGQAAAWTALLAAVQAGQPIDMDALCADKALSWLLSPPRVAIVGVPNSGKSTLANALFARQRTITADLPGTTRDWIEDTANLDGFPIRLIDTPGLRPADCPIEQRAIANAREIIAQADLVILLLDPTCRTDAVQSGLRATYTNALRTGASSPVGNGVMTTSSSSPVNAVQSGLRATYTDALRASPSATIGNGAMITSSSSPLDAAQSGLRATYPDALRAGASSTVGNGAMITSSSSPLGEVGRGLDSARDMEVASMELIRITDDVPVLTVWSKADLRPADASADSTLRVSATQGRGLNELRHAIRSRFGCALLPLGRACIWTARQRSILASGLSPVEAIRPIVCKCNLSYGIVSGM